MNCTMASDEKDHQISLTEKGRDFLMPIHGRTGTSSCSPDLGTEMSILGKTISSLQRKQVQARRRDQSPLLERSDRIHTVRSFSAGLPALYTKDDEYVVTDDGKVQIVDEFTGRPPSGRRYSEGLPRRSRRRRVSRSNGYARPLPHHAAE